MRLKLLIVFGVSFSIIFGFRAYGDYTTGGFPAFGLMDFLWWTFIYSLISLIPAFFIFQIITPATSQSKQKGNVKIGTFNNILPTAVKAIATVLAVIVGGWIGGYIGILFTSDRQELDALTGGLYGAPIGAAIGLLLCWFIFTRRSRPS